MPKQKREAFAYGSTREWRHSHTRREKHRTPLRRFGGALTEGGLLLEGLGCLRQALRNTHPTPLSADAGTRCYTRTKRQSSRDSAGRGL